MILNNYASIGKAVLYRATGLQKNYIETVTKVTEQLDEELTGCYNCENYRSKELFKYYPESLEFKACCNYCDGCPNKRFRNVYEITKKYRNEKNRFGYSPRLKKLPLLLFITYHFLTIDKNGIIKDIDINELAELLDCNIKSVVSANEKLAEYGYIAFCNGTVPNKYINVLLPEYKKYFALANEGGRGYYICSKSTLLNMVSIKNINALRILLRELLSDDDNSVSNTYTGSNTKTFKEIRRSLPDYCKPNVIRKAVQQIKGVFNLHIDSNSVTFDIKPDYQAKKNKENCYIDNKKKLTEELNNFNKTIDNIEELEVNYPSFVVHGRENYSPISLDDKMLKDLISMSIQYSLVLVSDALAYVYKHYILEGVGIKNFGGLIRSKIKKSLNTDNTSYAIA